MTARGVAAGLRRALIKPHSSSSQDRFREYMLNLLLACLNLAATASLMSLLVGNPYGESTINQSVFQEAILFWILVIGLWVLARRWRYEPAAVVLIFIMAAFGLHMMIETSFMANGAELTLLLTVVASGVVLNTAGCILTASLLSVLVFVIAYLQVGGVLKPSTDWLAQPLKLGDAVVYVVIIVIVGILTWLANRAITTLFAQARQSEEQLEQKVADRTRYIKRLQGKRLEESQRFTQIGRQSAGMLHDISNTLTSLAINVDQLGQNNSRQLIEQIQSNAGQLERYLLAARKQIIGGAEPAMIKVIDEIRQTVDILAPQARMCKVKINVSGRTNTTLFGDPVKFSQMVANLISNAIDSYQNFNAIQRVVTVRVRRISDELIITVKDNGKGIEDKHLTRIYEPLYTTKTATSRGMGMGLTMVKQFIEQDFKGSITIASHPGVGTTCTLRLPLTDS